MTKEFEINDDGFKWTCIACCESLGDDIINPGPLHICKKCIDKGIYINPDGAICLIGVNKPISGETEIAKIHRFIELLFVMKNKYLYENQNQITYEEIILYLKDRIKTLTLPLTGLMR